ncbi:zinc finger protein 585A-like [Wyeomyia smithii]|uniref:zinc finger protein 585A-like n=1 Tax=Wyeomyia smithii TaxID=174621 RepID=UPI0024681F56|nr:zinc finger protein 585A-like [Wyeomyia smithii]
MDKYCRVCARSDEFKRFPLETVSQISDVRIDDMLIYCTQLEIVIADSLPQQICADCFTALNSAFTLRKLCFHSDNNFRRMIEDIACEQQQDQASFADDPIDSLEIPSNIFDDICIKQEVMPTEEFFVSLVADAQLEDIPKLAQTEFVARRTKKRVFVCNCSYSTSNRFNFNRHQRTMHHSGSQEFVVPKPVQTMQRKRKLKINGIIQYTAKFVCEDCGYQNNNQFNFKRHLLSGKHLKNTYLRLNQGTAKLHFQCDFCGKSSQRRHSECKKLRYFDEGVPPDCFGFIPQRVIKDTLEIAKLTKEDGMPIFTSDYVLDQSNNVGSNRPPLKLIELVIDFVHCYAISMQGYRCCKCSLFFSTPGALKIHRNSKHPVRRTSSDSINQCGKCYQPFLGEDSFRYHKQLEQSKWLIFCIACQVMIVSNTAWNAHSHFHHGKKTSFGSFEMIVVGEKFRCCSCDSILDSQEALETHQTEVHFPDWQNSLDSLELHECEKCFKQFATVKQLASHVELRMSRRFFRCLTRGCQMEFKNEQEAVLHTNNCFKLEPADDVKDLTIRCCFTACLEEFTTKTALKSHIESNHSHQIVHKVPSSAKYACNRCDMPAETDEPNEGHAFSALQPDTHENAQLETEFVTPDVLDLESPTEKQSDQHKQVEDILATEDEHQLAKQYKCIKCDKCCKTAAALKLHALTHSKYKFICRICGKRYREKGTLLKHQSLHNRLLKFQCPRCPFRTGSQGFLRLHMRKLHPKLCQLEDHGV